MNQVSREIYRRKNLNQILYTGIGLIVLGIFFIVASIIREKDLIPIGIFCIAVSLYVFLNFFTFKMKPFFVLHEDKVVVFPTSISTGKTIVKSSIKNYQQISDFHAFLFYDSNSRLKLNLNNLLDEDKEALLEYFSNINHKAQEEGEES